MKNIKLTAITLFLGLFLFSACNDNNEFFYDNTPPDPPTNLEVYVGDRSVELTWDKNRESDVAGYNIYYNYDYDGEYTLIGNTDSKNLTHYVDYDVKNGDKYYYAVAAYDYDNNESELSYDEVYAAPRPEGQNQSIFDYTNFPETSGYDFSDFLVLPYDYESIYDDLSADFFFENYNGTFYLNVWEDSEIQDMGYTSNIYDVEYAPNGGWEPMVPGDNVKYVEAFIGKTYVIWTWDNHYAKIRVKDITNERIKFDWTYQLREGESQLKRNSNNDIRKQLPNKIIKSYTK